MSSADAIHPFWSDFVHPYYVVPEAKSLPSSLCDGYFASAFLYDESKGRYAMAPAYDLTYAPSIPEHHMTCFGNGSPTEDDLLHLAEKMNIPAHKAKQTIQKIKEKVLQRLNQWMD